MKYIITAGGTGGHIYPALNLAKSLKEDGDEIIFISSSREIDKQILKDIDGIIIKHYKMDGLIRSFSPKAVVKNLINVVSTIIVFIKSLYILLTFKPNAVIGFGGFITFPIVFLSTFLKCTSAIHEQNSYPGLVNRKLSSKVDIVFYTYESSLKYFTNTKKLVSSSNPCGILAKDKGDNVKQGSILLVGGSLGAEKINDVGFLLANQTDYDITLICGNRYYEDNKGKELPSNLTLIEYSNELVNLIKSHELVISRAGASTLIEVIYANTLTIAIPSPNVVANHQEINAKELADANLIKYIIEDELTLDLLLDDIDDMFNNKEMYYNNMLNYSTKDAIKIIKEEM